MRIYDIAFYAASFFLLGVLIQSFQASLLTAAFVAALAAVFFLLIDYLKPGDPPGQGNQFVKFVWLAGLAPLIFLGALYISLFVKYQIQEIAIEFDKKISFAGVLVKAPERGTSQKVVINLEPPYAGRVLVALAAYPEFDYGDLVQFEGVIKKPAPPGYAAYLAKERIFGVTAFPGAELLSRDRGSATRAALFRLKEKTILNFQRVLGPEEAAYLSGVTLGERAEFSKELKEAMNKSGTTHLVALSGYNISILAAAVGALFTWFVSWRWTFILSILTILVFVLMTGAEASVVRAAIMGSIFLLSGQVGRVYSFRNAVVVAALLMVVVSPLVLRFDSGFQLSFIALLGIVYLSPAIRRFLGASDDPGFFLWRDNFFTTIGAQSAVAPLLIISFGNFSLTSFLSNLLILVLIPLTMGAGFILGVLGFISYHLALIVGWFLNLLLSYELFIIKFFGGLSFFEFESMNRWAAAAYYLALLAFIAYTNITTSLKK